MLRIIISIVFISGFAFSLPQYRNMLMGKVPTGKLVHGCVTCHMEKGSLALNLFGQDYRAIFVQPNFIKFPGIQTATFEQKWDLLLNKLDSNKNGQSNYQDIINELNPGK